MSRLGRLRMGCRVSPPSAGTILSRSFQKLSGRSLDSRSSAVSRIGLYDQKRTVIHAQYTPVTPRPPPREYEADGSLRRYPTNSYFCDHGISWVRWHPRNAGLFHNYFQALCAEELGSRDAYRQQFRFYAQFIPIIIFGAVGSAVAFSPSHIGISPLIYTQDWLEASRERDRAENSYPLTRYQDRRRKERGPHWILGAHCVPSTPNFVWQYGQRDTAYLRARAIKARQQYLEEERRRNELQLQDSKLEITE